MAQRLCSNVTPVLQVCMQTGFSMRLPVTARLCGTVTPGLQGRMRTSTLPAPPGAAMHHLTASTRALDWTAASQGCTPVPVQH